MSEVALLDRIRARAAQSQGQSLRLGIGDDSALLRLRRDEELAVTTDLSIRAATSGWTGTPPNPSAIAPWPEG